MTTITIDDLKEGSDMDRRSMADTMGGMRHQLVGARGRDLVLGSSDDELLRAVVTRPRLILLDEPTNGL